jgi:hypothetical protein
MTRRRSLVLDTFAVTTLHQVDGRRPGRLQPYRAQLLEHLDTYVTDSAWARTTTQWREVRGDQLQWVAEALVEVLSARRCLN